MTIKTFRGLIAEGGIDTIPLATRNGSTGYKLVKFQVIGQDMPGTSSEAVVLIWKTPQTTALLTIDFSNQELLGAAYFSGSNSPSYTQDQIIIFDSEIFNQDIYVTYNDGGPDTPSMNYYIELEQVKLDLTENTVATLKDIRNITAPT